MNNNDLNTVLTVDLNRRRIRIHKAMLRLIDEPKYVQLLVNPDDMVVALLFVDRKDADNETHKVNINSRSIEICSKEFVSKLGKIANISDEYRSFRLNGKVVPSKNMAVFSLKEVSANKN